MPGHDAIANLTQDQKGTAFEGGPFITFGSGTPSDGTSGTIAGGKGAIYVNTAGGAGTTMYVNVGTLDTPDWNAMSS